MKPVMMAIGGFVAVIAFFVVLSLASSGFRALTAPWFGWVDAEVQQESAGNRIFQYETFFNLCAKVQSTEANIASQLALLDTLEPGSNQYSMTQTNIAGLRAARNNAITEYNSRSTRDYTSARFKDANLPYRISLDPFNGNNRTRCAAE